MSTINVKVAVQSLFCFQGPDENGESEPYLWVIMFKLDGSSVVQSGTSLTGTPGLFFSAGSHGNLGTGVIPGATLTVPPSVGTWSTTLQPLVLTDPNTGLVVEVPGVIGEVSILLEQNSTPDDAIEAGHQALNNYVTQQFQAFINSINLTTVSATVQQMVDAGADPTAATISVINGLLQPTLTTIASMADPVVIQAIFDNIGIGGILTTIVTLGDKDDFQGSATHVFSQTDLAATASNGQLYGMGPKTFSDKFVDPNTSDRWQFNYTLSGQAWQPIEIIYQPIPPGVPAGRWQINGANTAHLADGKGTYINQVGGNLADGSRWWLNEPEAVTLLTNGTNSFFVTGADGSTAEVIASDTLAVGHLYLSTQPDGSTQDNLASLPTFATSIEIIHNDPS